MGRMRRSTRRGRHTADNCWPSSRRVRREF